MTFLGTTMLSFFQRKKDSISWIKSAITWGGHLFLQTSWGILAVSWKRISFANTAASPCINATYGTSLLIVRRHWKSSCKMASTACLVGIMKSAETGCAFVWRTLATTIQWDNIGRNTTGTALLEERGISYVLDAQCPCDKGAAVLLMPLKLRVVLL